MSEPGADSRILLALAGDTMLGRGVAERLREGDVNLFSEEVGALVRRADLFVLNLECCISERGQRWPDPDKPFFFRAPPEAVDILSGLGVDCVTLANNHALDFGKRALLDTLDYLAGAGIAVAGAGVEIGAARAPAIVPAGGIEVAVIAVTDHPVDFAAGESDPGVAYADLKRGTPEWLLESLTQTSADVVLVAPHWGPNMVSEPVPHVRRAAAAFRHSGAALVAGHSAHVVHGAHDQVLFDLGDFIDDYALDPLMRNDLGMLFLVTIEGSRPTLLEAIPLKLDYCFTRLAVGADASFIAQRFLESSVAMGTNARESDGRIVVRFD
jgi:poly-gamma-glutamate capsule biosynthesis protein CapA/YwtB (metallophosphatase superfamily)